jgi:hypothetical protein
MGLKNWPRIVLRKLSEVFKGQPADEKLSGNSQYSLLARFIFQSGHFSKFPAKPKQNAFLPHPSTRKISALWIDSLSEREIWDIGDLLGLERSKQPLAHADFGVAAVSEAKLTIEADSTPHPRHVNLGGWPIGKDEQKLIALLLCARSILKIR